MWALQGLPFPRFYDSSSLADTISKKSPAPSPPCEKKTSARAPYSGRRGPQPLASAPACRDPPRPVCGREAAPPPRTRMGPGAAGAGDAAGAAVSPRPARSCSGVAHEEPPPRLVPAPGGWAPA